MFRNTEEHVLFFIVLPSVLALGTLMTVPHDKFRQAIFVFFGALVMLLIIYAIFDIYEKVFLAKYKDKKYHKWFAWRPVRFRKEPRGIHELANGGRYVVVWLKFVYKGRYFDKESGVFEKPHYLTIEDYNELKKS